MLLGFHGYSNSGDTRTAAEAAEAAEARRGEGACLRSMGL